MVLTFSVEIKTFFVFREDCVSVKYLSMFLFNLLRAKRHKHNIIGDVGRIDRQNDSRFTQKTHTHTRPQTIGGYQIYNIVCRGEMTICCRYTSYVVLVLPRRPLLDGPRTTYKPFYKIYGIIMYYIIVMLLLSSTILCST